METESHDFESRVEARREAAAASMKPVTIAALRELTTNLFPQIDHPWEPVYRQFLDEHENSPAVHGNVTDGMEYVFFPRERKGIWYRTTGGVLAMGPILERGLTSLSAIARDKGLL